MTLEVLANQLVAATLGASLTSGATTLTLATGDGAKFPATGLFHVLISDPLGAGAEVVAVGGVAGDTLTGLVRGQEGTVAVAHALGDTVELVPTAASFYRVMHDARGWGVAVDGVTDDTAALNAAMAAVSAAGGGDIRLGPGVCLCGQLTPQPDVTLVGAGMDATTIKLKNATNASMLVATSAHRFALRDLTLDGNKANNTGVGNWSGLFLTTSDDVRVHRCRFVNIDWIAIALAGCKHADVSENAVEAPGYVGVWMGTAGAVQGTGSRVVRNRITDTGLDAIICGVDDVLIAGNYCRGNGTVIDASGVYVDQDVSRVRVEGNHCEATTNYGIDCHTADVVDNHGVVIIGNVCIANKNAGIGCNSNGAMIIGNTCLNNGQASGAYPYGILLDALGQVCVGNTCTDTQGTKTQTYGISLRNVSTVTAQATVVANDLRGNVNAGINGLTTIGTGHTAFANRGAPDLIQGPLAVGSITSDHKLVLESAASDHLRLIRTGSSYLYESYVDGNRIWIFAKPTGNTGSSLNALFKFITVGGIDSINPYWNGIQFQGHTVTEVGVSTFPILGFYSRSAAAADPTDYEFVFELANAGTLPASIQYRVPDTAGGYYRWRFGTTDRLRVNRAGDVVLSQIATPAAPATGFSSLYVKSDAGVYVRAAGGAEVGLAQVATDLGNTSAAPNVVGLRGSALPANAADGFLKRNAANTAWEAAAYGAAANTVAQGNDARMMSFIEPDVRIFYPLIPTSGTFLMVSGTAYWVYLGRLVVAATPKFVEFLVTTAGAGAQTAEVGLFSTPNAPSKTAQSLTKLVATGTVDAMTTTGVKRNTTAFATSIPAGTHLWAGVRTAMATTQVTLRGVFDDWSEGGQLSLAAAAVLTTAGPWAGALVAVNLTAAQGPALRVTMD